jgi:glycosyltransferase involved in cell wall biosynthesis
MRVAFVTAFPRDPELPHGGVEAVSVNLVRALSELDDLELDVVTHEAGRPQAEISLWNGVSIHRLPRSDRHVLTDAIGPGRRLVSSYVRNLRPDVIHAHDVFGLMVKGLPIPRVFTIHGFIHGDTAVSGTPLAWLRARAWRWIETSGWANQPHVISISPYVRERLSGIATGVIHDIDNPISPAFFDIERREQRGRIFSAALICQRKNQIGLLEAFARLIQGGCDAELRLAGTISEPAYGQELQRRISAYGLTDRVKLLGSLSSTQVREELVTASAFALVSLEEGSPMGVEEAMAAGVPVVTSNRCGMPYMVRDGESGFLVDPLDSQDIAWRLGQLLADDELRVHMAQVGRRIAEDRFHPDVVARRTREVYRRAVRDPGNGNGHAHG